MEAQISSDKFFGFGEVNKVEFRGSHRAKVGGLMQKESFTQGLATARISRRNEKMMRTTTCLISTLLTALLILSASADTWPSWRGDSAGSGKTSETGLPTSWSADKNVRWRIELPERGNSTPVISGGKIFVTQAVDAEKFRGLYCFDRTNGKQLWKSGVVYDKPERSHRDNPYCSASPVTDGEQVFVSFGSAGGACYNFAGKEIWKQDLGRVDHEWGNSTSPVLCGDLCIQYHGPGEGAFLVGHDKKTGKIIWMQRL